MTLTTGGRTRKRTAEWHAAGQRRGVVEIQFNWIFTLIIGGMILTFFFALASKQQQLSEKKLGAEMSAELDLLFTGQGASSNTITTLDVPDVSIEFSCEDYSILNVPRRIGNTLLFSPETIKADRVIGMTLPWTVPFKVANMYYLSTPAVKYYIINAPEDVRGEIEDTLPKGLDVSYLSLDELAAVSPPKATIRLVLFNTPAGLPANFRGVSDTQLTAVVLQGTLTSLDSASQAHFLRKSGDALADDLPPGGSAVLPVIGKAGIVGAMIAESSTAYECTMMRAVKRLASVASIYRDRTQLLTAARPDCATPTAPLDDIIQASQAAAASPSATLQAVQEAIGSSKAALEAANLQALRASCPTVY